MLIHKVDRITIDWNQYWVLFFIGFAVVLYTPFITPNGTGISEIDLFEAESANAWMANKITRLREYEAKLEDSLSFWSGAMFVYLYQREIIQHTWLPHYWYVWPRGNDE